MSVNPSILILGTRGIPADHGGFETFAEKLALYLASRGWRVGVYCQDEVPEVTQRIRSTHWNGIEQIRVQVASTGPKATLAFDWMCVRDAARRGGLCLVLGYNGAAFLPWLKLFRRPVVTNMDGIEWRRPKWGFAARSWFWTNEWIAAWVSDTLVADHPEIAAHLRTRTRRRQVMIPYGADPVLHSPVEPLSAYGLTPDRYLISVARIEPDNNILTMVEAFSRKRRGQKLVVLGDFKPDRAYDRAVRTAASDEVVFPGGIYDQSVLKPLRFHARAYLHGHTVGGTNPSLVEALAAGNPVVAHDNRFNRWTVGPSGRFFVDADDCERQMEAVLSPDFDAAAAQSASRAQAAARFQWSDILSAYEDEFLRYLPDEIAQRSPLAT